MISGEGMDLIDRVAEVVGRALRIDHIGQMIDVPFLDVFRPGAMSGRPMRAMSGRGRSFAGHRQGKPYKGSARAKTATRRGGNPARAARGVAL